MKDSQQEKEQMMKFSSNSWHFKLVKDALSEHYFYYVSYGDRDESGHYPRTLTPKRVNLCPYVRTVIGLTLTWPIWKSWRRTPNIVRYNPAPTAFFVCVAIATMLTWYIDHRLPFIVGGAEGAITGGIFGVMGVSILIDKIKMIRRKNQKPRSEPKPKTPNLLHEFIKAKHSKICPCIEFVDEKEQSKIET